MSLQHKRILMTVTNDLVYDRRMYRICTALSEAGAEVVLIGRLHKHSIPFEPRNFIGKRFRCWINKGPLFYAEFNIRLFFLLLFSRFDMLCACDLDTALPARLASWMKGKKTTYDAHEYFSEVPELIGRPTVRTIWDKIGKWTVPHFSARYTVGEELAVILADHYKADFNVVRNIEPSVNHHSPVPGLEERERIIFYQGALNVGRGIEACIQAMVHLPNWQFWIAGEGDITRPLKELTERLRLNDRVKFLGWVKPEQLPVLMRKARLAVNVLEQDSLSYYYSLPNKFFDAIHAGLPSINMNYPEYARIIARFPCAILLDEVNVHDIVKAIQSFDENPQQWADMSAACLEAAREYTWEKESERLVEMYVRLIK